MFALSQLYIGLMAVLWGVMAPAFGFSVTISGLFVTMYFVLRWMDDWRGDDVVVGDTDDDSKRLARLFRRVLIVLAVAAACFFIGYFRARGSSMEHVAPNPIPVMAAIREWVVRRMMQLVPGDGGGFLVGLYAGGLNGVSRQVIDDVRRTGLTHIVAVSGYNVSLLLQWFGPILLLVPRRGRALVVSGFLFVFLLFVGVSGSALRAVLMGGFSVWSVTAGRSRLLLLAILWSAVAMVLYDPSFIVDRGFQLSFLATIGVSYGQPLVAAVIPEGGGAGATIAGGGAGAGAGAPKSGGIFFEMWRFVREPIVATVAVYLCTVPIMVSFGTFSAIGVAANVIFVPFVAIFMMLGAAVFIVSLVSMTFASFIGFVGGILVHWYFTAIHAVGALPFAVVTVSPWGPITIMVYYTVLAACIAKFTPPGGA